MRAGGPQEPVFSRRSGRFDVAEAAGARKRQHSDGFSATAGVEFAGSAGLQAESARAFSAFVEDRPVEVVGQVAKGQLRFGTSQADRADKPNNIDMEA